METPYVTEQISFPSAGSVIAGVLYRPTSTPAPMPAVVLAHGFSGTMDWIVPDFAERFAEGGLAALVFDYRHLGLSGGEPRQLIDSRRQVEDLRNAVTYMRSRPDIDASRIALWGTSLGGSHVLNVAAADPAIAAVVANVPGFDLVVGVRGRHVPAHMKLGAVRIVAATTRLLGAAVVDAARGALGLRPFYIPVYGKLGRAVFSDPELAGLFADVERYAPTWRNRVTPRFLFIAPRYRRGTMERLVPPLLVTVARDDDVISTAFVTRTAARAPRHEIREYPVRHFDVYHGEVRDRIAADHLTFLRHHLRCEEPQRLMSS
ncbi:alpha/beta fold hydrolase [Mycobacterium sp. B14F4]|uniref:alpha/beta hydrolase n=1 Tax=Mycobacterium sp. B14F4 TaxID=3153565 RepID=UPI00325CF56C